MTEEGDPVDEANFEDGQRELLPWDSRKKEVWELGILSNSRKDDRTLPLNCCRAQTKEPPYPGLRGKNTYAVQHHESLFLCQHSGHLSFPERHSLPILSLSCCDPRGWPGPSMSGSVPSASPTIKGGNSKLGLSVDCFYTGWTPAHYKTNKSRLAPSFRRYLLTDDVGRNPSLARGRYGVHICRLWGGQSLVAGL
ncbi:hypothetical protein CDEST_12523 [Colletotrichum destructivum]|uniref:Uncharacterized protein n=1 Tax=Colletotrichum destructivum TaxID=34406 RepID=A0AAX4IW46_9PEZI|nr:hypothetical protein CDEST_12523 [Colletotrichum destructivum]